MSLRTSSALAGLAMLAGCGAQSPPPDGELMACAIGSGAEFADVCRLERVAGSQEVILHHPDGGFRRLNFDPATGTLAPLDGAEPLVIEDGGGTLQLAIGPDRYRVPRELVASPTP